MRTLFGLMAAAVCGGAGTAQAQITSKPIDTNALVKALSERRIAGAGLDTFSPEPPPADSPLWGLPTLVATPHVGANTTEARERVGLVALKQVLDVWAGNALDPRCVVNRHLFAS